MRSTTMAAGRLLLVCVFCAILCGAAAGDAGGAIDEVINKAVKAAVEAIHDAAWKSKTALNNAEFVKSTVTSPNGITLAKPLAGEVEGAVKEAINYAGAAKSGAQTAERAATDLKEAELTSLLGAALQKTEGLLEKLRPLEKEAREMNSKAQQANEFPPNEGEQKEIQQKAEAIVPKLKEADKMGEEAAEAYKEMSTKAEEVVKKLKKLREMEEKTTSGKETELSSDSFSYGGRLSTVPLCTAPFLTLAFFVCAAAALLFA